MPPAEKSVPTKNDWLVLKQRSLARLPEEDGGSPGTLRTLCESHLYLGEFHEAARRFAEFEKKASPGAGVYFLKARIAKELGAIETAIESCRKCLEIDTGNSEALRLLAQITLEAHDFQACVDVSEELLRLQPDDWSLDSSILFNRQYLDRTPREEAERINRYQRHLDKVTPLPPRPQTKGDDRIRIGYVSSDFTFHPTHYFIDGILRVHDREKFEIHCFQTTSDLDLRSHELAALCDRWHECGDLNDHELALAIQAEEIDLLIDLTGHMKGGRPLLFGYRPAPRQGIWLGWLSSMGIRDSDFRLSDWQADPSVEDDALCPEDVVRLDAGIVTFAMPPFIPGVGPLPSLERDGEIWFGSFNNSLKQGEDVLALWAAVLKSIPNSKIILKHMSYSNSLARKRTMKAFESRGIARERVIIKPGQARNSEHLEGFHEIDISLDPFPYNGVTTTCESLCMGVPVLALRGRHYRARMGCSLLTQIGRPRWIADSKEEFVELAVEISSDLPKLAAIRSGLREEFLRSPLGDPVPVTRALEEKASNMDD